MKEIDKLALERIQQVCDEAEKQVMGIGHKVLYPDKEKELKFDEVCAISERLREVKQWADAILENEEG